MGKCKYCGGAAGIFKKQHKACEVRYEVGWESMVNQAVVSLSSGSGFDNLLVELQKTAEESYVSPEHVRTALVRAWQRSVDKFLEDQLLSEQEEERLGSFRAHFQLRQEDLDDSGALTRVVKAGTLRDIANGKVPARVKIDGALPFNLQKGEDLVWVFQNVAYLTEKSRTVYEGRSSGMSFRIARGVYYRVGAFKGSPKTSTFTVHEDTGLLGLTTKHVYFAGLRKAFRIAYGKIVAVNPYSDGVGIQKDGVNSKPIVFTTGDGWFTCNLINGLSQL